MIFGIAFLITAFIFYHKSYTLVVFGTLGFAFILIRYIEPSFMVNFFIAFLISKVPFFLVNGYLTASPVVVYDDEQNLGIRLFTIPVEDAFYSLLLLMMNTFFYELFLKKRR